MIAFPLINLRISLFELSNFVRTIKSIILVSLPKELLFNLIDGKLKPVEFSEKVSLLQLNEFSNPEAVHNERYPFYTSSSDYMTRHFKDFAQWLSSKYLSSGSKLVEVGSNDGTFLENFKDKNINAIGFEPSTTIARLANKKGIQTFDKFFNTSNLDLIKTINLLKESNNSKSDMIKDESREPKRVLQRGNQSNP